MGDGKEGLFGFEDLFDEELLADNEEQDKAKKEHRSSMTSFSDKASSALRYDPSRLRDYVAPTNSKAQTDDFSRQRTSTSNRMLSPISPVITVKDSQGKDTTQLSTFDIRRKLEEASHLCFLDEAEDLLDEENGPSSSDPLTSNSSTLAQIQQEDEVEDFFKPLKVNKQSAHIDDGTLDSSEIPELKPILKEGDAILEYPTKEIISEEDLLHAEIPEFAPDQSKSTTSTQELPRFELDRLLRTASSTAEILPPRETLEALKLLDQLSEEVLQAEAIGKKDSSLLKEAPASQEEAPAPQEEALVPQEEALVPLEEELVPLEEALVPLEEELINISVLQGLDEIYAEPLSSEEEIIEDSEDDWVDL